MSGYPTNRDLTKPVYVCASDEDTCPVIVPWLWSSPDSCPFAGRCLVTMRRHSLPLGKAVHVAVKEAVATVDHPDIRGSMPHNRDSSSRVSPTATCTTSIEFFFLTGFSTARMSS